MQSNLADTFAACQSSRHAPYRLIHKALRMAMSQALLRVGNGDCGDRPTLLATLDQAEGVLGLCDSHLQHESQFMHAALSQRDPASLAPFDAEHAQQLEASHALHRQVAELRAAPHPRNGDVYALYLALSANFAHQWQHMRDEETRLTEAFWQHFNDTEILAIEQALVASIAPELRLVISRWMLLACHHEERMDLLGPLRAAMPAQDFDGLLKDVLAGLGQPDAQRLRHGLLQRPAQGVA